MAVSSSSSSSRWTVASLDMYRKVPGDLLEGTKEGRITSWIALCVMLWLFINETMAFWSTTIVTQLHLDSSKITKFQIDFNITMLDLRCDYATINVVSLLGNEQNITKDIKRWAVDGQGITKHLHNNHPDDHKNNINGKQQQQLVLSDPSINQTVEEIGKHAVSLDQETLEYAMEEHNFLFVKFYADWCSHCRALAPTWEKFAEIMHDVEEKVMSHVGQDYTEEEYAKAKLLHLPVLIGQVDCVEHHTLCRDQIIRGYPTMVLYVNGERYNNGGEYQGPRTLVDMIQFLENAEQTAETYAGDKIKNHTEMAIAKHMNMTKAHADWLDAMNRVRHHADRMWDAQEHPGCHLQGRLEMNRAPGHFFIQAKSESHSIDPRNANLSHVIHHLAFLPLLEERHAHKANNIFPDHFDQSKAMAPLDGLVFAVEQQHASWHHYLKLISTNTHHLQVLKSSQLSLYREDHVPEAKFVIDVSPIAISYSKRKRRWYDYISSIMAILGGTFTVVGLIESMVETTAKTITQRRKQPLRRPPPLPPPPRMGGGGGAVGMGNGNNNPTVASSTIRRVHPHPPPPAVP